MDLEILRGIVQVVDRDRAEDRRARNHQHVLAFLFVAVPRAHESGRVIRDHVEALYALEAEVVGEHQNRVEGVRLEFMNVDDRSDDSLFQSPQFTDFDRAGGIVDAGDVKTLLLDLDGVATGAQVRGQRDRVPQAAQQIGHRHGGEAR